MKHKRLWWYRITSWHYRHNIGWTKYEEFRKTRERAWSLVLLMRRKGHVSVRYERVRLNPLSKDEWDKHNRKRLQFIKKEPITNRDLTRKQPELLKFRRLGYKPPEFWY